MTIKDFILSKQESVVETVADMTSCKEAVTQEEIIELAVILITDAARIYNNGMKDALALMEKCDTKFLERKLPPHVNK